MSKTAALSIRIEPELLKRIKAAAEGDARSVAQYVTLLLEREHPAVGGPIKGNILPYVSILPHRRKGR